MQLRRRAKKLNKSEHSEPRPHALLAPPDMRGLGVSFLAVVEREGAPVELAPASAKAFLVH